MPTSTTTTPKFPAVGVKLTGRDGNAFAVLGACRAAAKKAGVPAADIAEFQTAAMSGDYDNLLRVAMEWFDVR